MRRQGCHSKYNQYLLKPYQNMICSYYNSFPDYTEHVGVIGIHGTVYAWRPLAPRNGAETCVLVQQLIFCLPCVFRANSPSVCGPEAQYSGNADGLVPSLFGVSSAMAVPNKQLLFHTTIFNQRILVDSWLTFSSRIFYWGVWALQLTTDGLLVPWINYLRVVC